MDTDTAMDNTPHQPPTSSAKATNSTTTISPPIPHTFDLGNLLLTSPSPLPPSPTPTTLATTARTCAQSLLNQLLLTCPIHTTPTSDIYLTLPPPTTPLPREKPLPAPKEMTKWEKFAKKKGIKDKKRGEGKMVYSEEKGEWVPKWGYKGRNKEGEGEWIVEVDEKKGEGKEGETVRGQGRRERVERMRRGRGSRGIMRRGRGGGVVVGGEGVVVGYL